MVFSISSNLSSAPIRRCKASFSAFLLLLSCAVECSLLYSSLNFRLSAISSSFLLSSCSFLSLSCSSAVLAPLKATRLKAHSVTMNLSNTQTETRKVKLHLQNVSIVSLIPNPDDDFQLSDKLANVKTLQL